MVNLKLENCGTIVRSTNLDKRSSTHARPWNVSTALHIKETTDVTMSNVTIVKSCGYGAVFYDVIGSVLITGATFSENTERNANHSPGYASGGGIYIEFRPNCKRSSLFMNSNSNYTFINCRFVNNYAEQQKSIPSCSNCEQFISYGRGGGVSFFSRGNARNNNLTIIGCHFEDNIALWGGGVFAEFDQHTGSNMVNIQESHFVNNIGFLGGGGVRIGINSDLRNGPNVVFVKDSTFVSNYALVGGGISLYRPSGDGKLKEKLTIDNCTFSANVADCGAAILLVRMEVDIVNSTIASHVNAFSKQHYYQGEGCVYIYSSFVTLLGTNNYVNNRMTGIMVNSSHIRNTGNLSFYTNTSMDSGRMVPHSPSRFEYSTARKRDPLIPSDSKYKEFAENTCPENYCNASDNGDGIEHVFNPNLQCATGRNETSVLCGKCDSDKSVAFGNEHCKPCKDYFGLFWLFLSLFCLAALVFYHHSVQH